VGQLEEAGDFRLLFSGEGAREALHAAAARN
jgi:hypothetical protein